MSTCSPKNSVSPPRSSSRSPPRRTPLVVDEKEEVIFVPVRTPSSRSPSSSRSSSRSPSPPRRTPIVIDETEEVLVPLSPRASSSRTSAKNSITYTTTSGSSPRLSPRSTRISAPITVPVVKENIENIIKEHGYTTVDRIVVEDAVGKPVLAYEIALNSKGQEVAITGMDGVGAPSVGKIYKSFPGVHVPESIMNSAAHSCQRGTSGSIVRCSNGICAVTKSARGNMNTEILTTSHTPDNLLTFSDGKTIPIIPLAAIINSPAAVDEIVNKVSPTLPLERRINCADRTLQLETAIKTLEKDVELYKTAVVNSSRILQTSLNTFKEGRSKLPTNLNTLTPAGEQVNNQIADQISIRNDLEKELLEICPEVDMWIHKLEWLHQQMDSRTRYLATNFSVERLSHDLTPSDVSRTKSILDSTVSPGSRRASPSY